MKINNKITPKGFRDYLFEESEAQTAVENRLSALFASRGYHSVVTPALEFMDVFTCPEPAIPIEQMYKLTDRNGRLLVLRPDITLPMPGWLPPGCRICPGRCGCVTPKRCLR